MSKKNEIDRMSQNEASTIISSQEIFKKTNEKSTQDMNQDMNQACLPEGLPEGLPEIKPEIKPESLAGKPQTSRQVISDEIHSKYSKNELDLLSIESQVIRSHLKPTSEYPIEPVRKIEQSYKNFFQDLPFLFTCKNHILRQYLDKYIKVIYLLDIVFESYTPSPTNYKFCKEKGDPYEGLAQVRLTVTKKIITSEEVKSKVIYEAKLKYSIPVFIGVYGRPTDGNQELEDDPLELGLYFIGKNHVTKTIINTSENTSAQAKLTKNKNKTNIHESFAYLASHAMGISSIDQAKQPQFLNLIFDIKNHLHSISSKNKRNYLKQVETIPLTSYLTRMSIESISDFVLALFARVMDNKLVILDPVSHTRVKLLFQQYKDSFNEEGTTQKMKIKEIIERTLTEEAIQGLFPMINSLRNFMKSDPDLSKFVWSSNKVKGATILNHLIQHIFALSQPSVYPSGDHILNTLTCTPGALMAKRVTEELQSLVHKTEQEVENLPKSSDLNAVEVIRIDKNKQDIFAVSVMPKNSQLANATKSPATLISDVAKINQVNTRTKNTSHLKKTKKRDVDESNYFHTGIATTPDNEYVNLQHNLNAAVVSGNKSIKTQAEVAKKILLFIYKHHCFHSISTEQLSPTDIPISFIDKSEAVIGFVKSEDCDTFITDMRNAKRKGLFGSQLISLWRVPNYSIHSCNSMLLPIDSYNNIKICLGQHDLFRLGFIVEDGILGIEKYQNKKYLFELKPYELIEKAPDTLEYLGAGELTYTNHCLSLKKFFSLSMEARKTLDYVLLGDILCRSFNEALTNDAERTNGARATFACGQQKNNTNTIAPTFLNTIESSKTVVKHHQRPLITNQVNIATKADEKCYCTIEKIGFGSLTNAEDSVRIDVAYIKTHMTVVKSKTHKSVDTFAAKGMSKAGNNHFNYDEEGKIKLQSAIRKGDAFNNETVIFMQNGNMYKNNKSSVYEDKQPGRIDKKITMFDGIKYSIKVLQQLSVGDKMNDLCAQKFTIQKVVPSNKMPYNINGERPLMIMNSQSICGRETYGVFSLLQKVNMALLTWKPGMSPVCIEHKPFAHETLAGYVKHTISYLMDVYGFTKEEALQRAYCKEQLFDPMTSKSLAQAWTCGHYCVCCLNQTAHDGCSVKETLKVNANREVIGSRIGEMDIMAMAETGALANLDEIQHDNIMLRKSVMVCTACGQPATKIQKYRQSCWVCLVCENAKLTPNIVSQDIPHKALNINQMTPTLGFILQHREDRSKDIYPK